MDTFYSLNKLLSTLPFSILGYYEHEKELDDFFERLCESDFISKKNNIELVSYSYARLDKLNEWGTESLSPKLFFHALDEKYSLLALNVYYSIRNKLFDRKEEDVNDNPHLSNNVAIVLSRLLLKDVGFRLSYTFDKDWHFSFLEQNQIFSIKIPLERLIKLSKKTSVSSDKLMGLFREALGKFLSDTVVKLNSEPYLEKLLIQKAKSRHSSYEKKSISTSLIDNEFDKFIKVFKSKRELEILRDEFVEAIYFWHTTNPGYLTISDTKEHIKNWVELFFQIVFISLVYNSWVEYFPSVCGLDESKQNREYRNLGGLILGYKIDENKSLTQEERSIFRIISSRISSTVAGQWMFDNNRQLKRERNKARLKAAHDQFVKLDNNIIHGISPITADFEKAYLEFWETHKSILTKEFEKSFNSLKTKSKDTDGNQYINKYCLIELSNKNSACSDCKIKITNPFFLKDDCLCCKQNSISADCFNIPLVKSLLEVFLKDESGQALTSTKNISDNTICIEVCHPSGFKVSNFIDKIKKSHNGSLIGTYFMEYYDLIDAHGVYQLAYEKDGTFYPFFDTRNAIKYVKYYGKSSQENKIILNEKFTFPTESDISALKIKITFKIEN